MSIVEFIDFGFQFSDFGVDCDYCPIMIRHRVGGMHPVKQCVGYAALFSNLARRTRSCAIQIARARNAGSAMKYMTIR